MDDFRIGSVPPPDTYGRRQMPDPKTSKHRKHSAQSDSEEERLPESFADTIEDIYMPSDPSGES